MEEKVASVLRGGGPQLVQVLSVSSGSSAVLQALHCAMIHTSECVGRGEPFLIQC